MPMQNCLIKRLGWHVTGCAPDKLSLELEYLGGLWRAQEAWSAV